MVFLAVLLPRYYVFKFHVHKLLAVMSINVMSLYSFANETDRALSRKFWSGGKIGPGDQNFRNIGPGGPFFPENFGPPVKIMVRPAP